MQHDTTRSDTKHDAGGNRRRHGERKKKRLSSSSVSFGRWRTTRKSNNESRSLTTFINCRSLSLLSSPLLSSPLGPLHFDISHSSTRGSPPPPSAAAAAAAAAVCCAPRLDSTAQILFGRPFTILVFLLLFFFFLSLVVSVLVVVVVVPTDCVRNELKQPKPTERRKRRERKRELGKFIALWSSS